MPIFFQQDIDRSTKLAIWKIKEEASFFLAQVPLQREITHPHKRLQHLAGRYLLNYLFPDFPLQLIQIADTRKPYLEDEAYHFSISHCGNYAAVIVSKENRVGIDIEMATEKVNRIRHKFISGAENKMLNAQCSMLNHHISTWLSAFCILSSHHQIITSSHFQINSLLHERARTFSGHTDLCF